MFFPPCLCDILKAHPSVYIFSNVLAVYESKCKVLHRVLDGILSMIIVTCYVAVWGHTDWAVFCIAYQYRLVSETQSKFRKGPWSGSLTMCTSFCNQSVKWNHHYTIRRLIVSTWCADYLSHICYVVGHVTPNVCFGINYVAFILLYWDSNITLFM